ncbi:MAG TPA: hypothetical protein VL096_13335 [Pirellulaceae bacterium]|nr:hypothetical protein [Pirellulaceae bacterium]
MSQPSLYEFIKLGMNLQHLRSIATVSIIPTTSLVAFPELDANQPGTRCSVRKTVELLKTVRVQLNAFGLTETVAAFAPLDPMQAEMEAALAKAAPGDDLILRDPFANRLVGHIKNLLVILKEETSARALPI